MYVQGLRVETHGGRTVLDNLQTGRQLETTYYVTDSKQNTDFFIGTTWRIRLKELETTYYVTDSKQITDFFWFRADSGIRVNIGLRHIRVIPLYDDVTHDDDVIDDVTHDEVTASGRGRRGADNDYFLNSPNSPDDREHFRSVVSNHCRFVYQTWNWSPGQWVIWVIFHVRVTGSSGHHFDPV